MVLEAGYPNTTGFRKVVKATILVKKKPGLSDADFISHYNTKHAEMAKGVLMKHGCITYSLTYHLQRDRNMMQDMLKGKANLLPYDAICTFVFADYMAFARFMYDPASKALTGDHDNFMVEEEMKMMVGDEFMVIEDGKMVS
ncbi:hypothetical protein AUEXF2481DRAFT_172790 [Aureobasidium subglaciale EXF-2481]|uniref:EthD domain-containing protein n=1 Tax=Aureobasidium subglaciale (strain EXF-2481) TaxID=1043005 RepID=A0A074ZLS4_AURSE|nr:uncharacterized protein AUEXF2481DRAFT_172790 [Aureobasidium subglaciale EXF-2481]KAI5202012.1 hypothetical protein E4T38_05780 [Aureobasidium subglaciale]KAI5220798.1 hypothetical protein E4T40_05711 [Aureobasidium subglaciale]KAI5224726.1 hypothetical protein E4T41_05630 [Aureobasidium subglaciale]KAI5260835.1 hypothetical protein E4T46_05534 [Aureobasidium subglaciale]KEQ99361.1 hypothetical protein AUEXF2481DRAFT_172790 [Aureobasidium subglaciale EXF-2481]